MKLYKILLLFLITITLSGCTTNYQSLNDMAIVSSVLIDKDEDNNFITYIELYKEEKSENKSKKVSYFVKGLGKTIKSSMNDAASSISRNLYYVHINAVIFSKDVASTNMEDLFNYLVSRVQINSNYYILISDNIKELLDTKDKDNDILGEKIDKLINNSTNSGTMANYDFMEKFKSEKMAEGIIEEIEKIIVEMLKKRSKVKKLTNDELENLGRIFDNNCSLNSMFSNNNVNIIKRYWLDTKENLTDTQIEMIGINPNLLSREEYSTYGFDIRTIACLSAYEISEVNNAIEENKNQKFQKEEVSFFKKFNLYLTTGSGFVDKLMLLSIVATELMVGIIVLFQLGGR